MILAFWIFSVILFILLMIGKIGGFLLISSDFFLGILLLVSLSPVLFFGKYFAGDKKIFVPKITVYHIILFVILLLFALGAIFLGWNWLGILCLVGILCIIFVLRGNTKFMFFIALALLVGVIISLGFDFKILANILSDYAYYFLLMAFVFGLGTHQLSKIPYLQKTLWNGEKNFSKEEKDELILLIKYGFFAFILMLFFGILWNLFPFPLGTLSSQNVLLFGFGGYLIFGFLYGCIFGENGKKLLQIQSAKNFWKYALSGGFLAILVLYTLVGKLYTFDKQFLFLVVSGLIIVCFSQIIFLLLDYGKK